MKLLWIGRSDLRSFGGIQTFCRELAAEFTQRGANVSYLQLERGGEGRPILHYRLTGQAPIPFTGCFGKSLRDCIDAERPDIIHSHNVQMSCQSVLQIIEDGARACGASSFLTVHDVAGTQAEAAGLLSLTSTIVATQSEFNRRRILGLGLQQCELLRVGIRFPASHVPSPTSSWTICSPGRLAPQKGAWLAVAALGAASRTRGKMTLLLSNPQCGSFGQSDEYLSSLKALAASFPSLTVEFNGDSDVRKMYTQSAMTLTCSVGLEGFGLVPLESLAFGRPVAAHITGGMRDWLPDLPGVRVVPSLDVNDVATSVVHVLDNLAEYQHHSYSASAALASRFDISRCCEEHLALYSR
jgi:glycosyltransferase involved in cell wall biosynthesis